MKLISAGWVVTCNHRNPIRDGALLIEEGKIIAVGLLKDLQTQYPEADVEEFPESVLLPGLINAHCHIDRTGFFERFQVETEAGLSPVSWLLEGLHYISRTPPEAIANRIKQSLEQMISTGITCIGAMAHYEGTFPIAKASPIRGVIFQEILSGPDKQSQQRFEVALALIDQYIDAKPTHLKIGFGPYSAYVLSRNLLNIISRHAKDNRLPLQIHAAESFAEMEFFYESKGLIATQLFPAIGWEDLPPPHRKTPIQHLADIGFFAGPLSIVGGYQLGAQDFGRLARGLAKIVYCPGANRRFKLGQLPLRQLREQGIPIALGTEVFSGSEGFDLWDEMRLALKEGSNPLPTPLELLKMATTGGAYALGYEKELGSLEPGKKADYLVVKKPQIQSDSHEELYRELILQTQHSSIQRVAIAGKTTYGV
ncbi:MAG: amidohydrolase family protein [Deltaproteobacteria bacterium]|nr:amidohydrolase family protein [Deltaproteobacteria bacterium]